MSSSRLPSQDAPQKNTLFFFLLLTILLAFSALCIYHPQTKNYSIFNRSWGFDHITYYGTNAKLFFFFVCFALIVPYPNNLIKTALSWLADVLARLAKMRVLLFLVLSVLSGFLFYLINVKYHFLGDFNLRLMQTMKKDFLATEYLTMRGLYTFARYGMKYGLTDYQSFKLYSYIAGSFFVFLSFLIADLTGKTRLQKILFFFSQLASAVLLVFCGYVEIYATPILGMSLYMYFALRYLKFKKGFVFAVLSLALAVGCHLLCLAGVPSLLVIWYFHNKNKVPFISRMSNKKTALVLAVLIGLSLIVALKARSGFLLGLTPPAAQPKLLTLFDPRHFWELFNGEILSCGLSFLFIFILLYKSIREKTQLAAEHYFLISLSGCFLLLVFMANLQRGSGDWDIMAFPAVSLNLLTIMLVAHLYKNKAYTASYLMIAITGLNAVQTFLWLQVNHTDKSIQKIEKMLVNDPGTYYTMRIAGAMQLALAYKNNHLPHELERAALMACNTCSDYDFRACVLYGLSLKEFNRLDEACHFFEELIRNRTHFSYESYLFVLEYYEIKDDKEKFDYYLNLLFDSFVQKPSPFTGSSNFKPPTMIRIFDALYQRTIPKNDPARLKKIKEVINVLSQMKPAPDKK